MTEQKDNEDILFEEEKFQGITVKAGTISELVKFSLQNFCEDTHTEETKAFVKVFFETYQWYISIDELLNSFLNLFDKALSLQDFRCANTIIKAIKYWIDNFGGDFENNESALNTLNIFNTKSQDLTSENQNKIVLNLEDWHIRKKSSYKKETARRPSLNFHELPSEDIAKQIAFLCWKGVKKIPFVEWMIYGKTAKTKDTPMLTDQICLFNDVSKYVIAMILNHENVNERAKAVQKFIAMSKCLLELKDFNTLLAVLGGLGHSTINRLYKTKELLSNAEKLFIKETHELLSSSHNYIKYRNKVDDCEGFVMPILGVVMKDLVALDTAVPDYIKHNSKKLINFHKMIKVSDIVHGVLQLRKNPPNVIAQKELRNIMRVSLKSRYTEDDLYDLSMQREPKREHKLSVVQGLEDAVFADWAAGVIPETPDRETVEKHVKRMVEAVFKTYDLDKNGSINKEEFDALATNFPFIDNFAVLDVNCDGDISETEMLNYFMNVNSQEMTKEFLHDFQEQSFYSPQYCVYCMGFVEKSISNKKMFIYRVKEVIELWGIGKSGYRCKTCQISCHKDCKDHVVMECRPNRSLTLRDKSRTIKKRLRYAENQDWRGSVDSSLNDSVESPSPRGSDYLQQSFDFSDASIIEKLKERITKLEIEKISLKKENSTLKQQLSTAESQANSLQLQLDQVRPLSVKFMLEQLERLSTCKETDL